MARPVVSSYTERLYKSVLPLAWADEEHDWALLRYCASIGSMVEDVDFWSADTEDYPGWHMILDVDLAPPLFLPWLAQFVGVKTDAKLPGETDAAWEARMRNKIRSVAGFGRGSVPSIRSAVQAYLTGLKQVSIFERDTSPYHFTVTTRFGETPVEEWPTTNLIANGGFETNSAGWAADGLEVRSTEKAKFGVASLKSATFGAVNDTIGIYSITSGFVSGDILTYSIYVNPNATVTLNLQVNQDPGLIDFSEGPITVCPANVWTRLTHTRVVVPGAATLSFYITSWGIQPVTDVYLDGAQIEKYSVATPYVETDGAIASRIAGMGNIRRAILEQKPGGLQFDYNVVGDWTYNDLDAMFATYNAIDAAFSSYDDIDNGP